MVPRFAAAFVIAVLFAPPVSAQTSTGTPAPTPQVAPTINMDAVVHAGDKVLVAGKAGGVRKGTVFTVSPLALEILKGKRKETIAAGDIWTIRIEYEDRISDGAKHGALAGLIIGGSLGFIAVISTCGDRDSFLDFCSAGGFLGVMGLLGGYGAGIGAATGVIGDALLSSSREVWRSPAGQSRLTVAPIATRNGAGAMVTIRW